MTIPPPHRTDLTQVIIGAAVVVVLVSVSLWILRPFLLALIWACSIVVATWPLLLAVRRRAGGNRWLAAALMTTALILAFLLPMALIVTSVTVEAPTIAARVLSMQQLRMPDAPSWLAGAPVIGGRLTDLWQDLTKAGWSTFNPYIDRAGGWLLGSLSSISGAILEVVLTVVIAALLYLQGDAAAHGMLAFASRLAGHRGERAAIRAAHAVRAIAIGVIGSAMLQAIFGFIGLTLAGMPLTVPLSFLIFMLCVAQVGALPVLVPAIGWVWWNGDTVSAAILAVTVAVVLAIDNVLRPLVIRRGADLPMVLILAGVLGGLLSIGLVGIFIGPVVLAVTYRLLQEWVVAPQPVVDEHDPPLIQPPPSVTSPSVTSPSVTSPPAASPPVTQPSVTRSIR